MEEDAAELVADTTVVDVTEDDVDDVTAVLSQMEEDAAELVADTTVVDVTEDDVDDVTAVLSQMEEDAAELVADTTVVDVTEDDVDDVTAVLSQMVTKSSLLVGKLVFNGIVVLLLADDVKEACMLVALEGSVGLVIVGMTVGDATEVDVDEVTTVPSQMVTKSSSLVVELIELTSMMQLKQDRS